MNSESDSAVEAGPAAELDRLELTVRRLCDAHARLRERAHRAETRVRELENALGEVSEGRLDPVGLAEEAERLRTENGILRQRLEEAYAGVQRMLARVQFGQEEIE